MPGRGTSLTGVVGASREQVLHWRREYLEKNAAAIGIAPEEAERLERALRDKLGYIDIGGLDGEWIDTIREIVEFLRDEGFTVQPPTS